MSRPATDPKKLRWTRVNTLPSDHWSISTHKLHLKIHLSNSTWSLCSETFFKLKGIGTKLGFKYILSSRVCRSLNKMCRWAQIIILSLKFSAHTDWSRFPRKSLSSKFRDQGRVGKHRDKAIIIACGLKLISRKNEKLRSEIHDSL